MNPNSPLTIYAMLGPMGSGKTTLALKIAKEKRALFQSLDGTIKSFNEPIGDLSGYEQLMPRALVKMRTRALAALKQNQSVVFDVLQWPLIKEIADAADAKIEIYCFDISAEERWRRVQQRNLTKPEGVYHWTMSKTDFDSQKFQLKLPPPEPGLTIIHITG